MLSLILSSKYYITRSTDNTWEQLKSELSVRFIKVFDPHHSLSLLHKTRWSKSDTVHIYAERLYAFVKLNKEVVESYLVGFFINGLYSDYFLMKIMRENLKTFQVAAVCISRANSKKIIFDQIEWKIPIDRLRNLWKLITLMLIRNFHFAKRWGIWKSIVR